MMSHLNKKGPENKGSQTGRKLGLCIDSDEYSVNRLGKGMGLKRKSIKGIGLGKRLRSSEFFNNNNK